MTNRRVVITGLGVVSPYGCDADAMFNALVQGASAVRLLTVNTSAGSVVTAGAAVCGEPWTTLPRNHIATSDRISLYALVAADLAIRDSRIDLSAEDRGRFGVSTGTSLGGAISQESAYADIFVRGATKLSPFTLVKVMYNGPTAQVALRYGLRGPCLTYSTTCSSSAVSIGEAMRQIRHGYADIMLAGGSEALFAYVSLKAWQALQVLAPPRPENVAATCRPFSRDRNGTVLGDGAAYLVLETWEHARERDATIYAELVGYGICNDSSHMTQPSASAQTEAMRLALLDANMNSDYIDYINAHGTGTPLNDLTETEAVKTLFGKHARELAMSSTKSMHGHLVGAAGALELLICALSVKRQQIPPTAHLHEPDPLCDLDHVPLVGTRRRVRAAMSNSFAVGGTASVLVVRDPQPQ